MSSPVPVSERASQFNPAPDSTGFTLYELWEQDSGGGRHLLHVTSTPPVTLNPGDVVVQRTWAPAGTPEIVAGPLDR